MNKYLVDLKLSDLIGKSIKSEKRYYTILQAKFEKDELLLFFADIGDAKKDEKHRKELTFLKRQLEADKSLYNTEFDWISCIYATVKNPFLRNNQIDFSAYFRSKDYEIDNTESYERLEENQISTIDDVKEELKVGGFIGGLRNIFAEAIGDEYKNGLKDCYVSLAKKNNRNYIDKNLLKIKQCESEIKSFKNCIEELDEVDIEIEDEL